MSIGSYMDPIKRILSLASLSASLCSMPLLGQKIAFIRLINEI